MAKLSSATHAAIFAHDKLEIAKILASDKKERNKKIAVYEYVLMGEALAGTSYVLTIPEKNPYIVLGLSNEALALPKHGRGADGFFAYLEQRYGLSEREKLTQFVYDNLRLYAYQQGVEVELRRFAYYSKSEAALYLSRYNGQAFRIDGTYVETVRNGDGVYFADDDFGVPCDGEVVVQPNGVLFDALTNLNFATETPSGITPEVQRRAITVWLFALAFPDLMPTKPLILFEGPPGSGKCLKLHEKILKYDGTVVEVQDVKVGDRLMGPDSRPRTVLHTTRGHGPLYRVNPTKGDPWVCNDAHILTLVSSHQNRIVDIPVKVFLAGTNYFRTEHKQFFTAVDFPPRKKPLPIDPYFLGFWYGDGTKDLSSVSNTKPDPEVKALVEKTAKAWGCFVRTDTNSCGCPTYAISMGNIGGVPGKNKLLTALRAVVADGKTLPHEYLTASRADRAQFLAGILDADGFLDNNCFDICQRERGFADGICFLARSLGIRATMAPKIATIRNPETGKVKEYPCWRITLSGEMSWLPLRIPRRKPNPRKQIKNATRTGIQIEPLGDGDYAGFTLDGDGRFLLSDFTVTHNSSSAQCIQLALLGDKKSMILGKNKENDFGVLLLRSPIALIDNMDSYIGWIPDAIAAYATSGVWPSRKLYTDDAEVVIRPQSFIAIASKNPASFRAEDVAERTVIIRLARRDGFTRQERIEANIKRHRGLILGEYVYYLNEIVRVIREGEMDRESEGGEMHRMADFAALARVVARVLDWRAEQVPEGVENGPAAAVVELLSALQGERDAFVNEEDPLSDLLHQWLDQKTPGYNGKPTRYPNVGRSITTQELFSELERIARDKSQQFYKSTRQLAQKIRSPHLANEFTITSTTVRNTRAYQIYRKSVLTLVPAAAVAVDADEIIETEDDEETA